MELLSCGLITTIVGDTVGLEQKCIIFILINIFIIHSSSLLHMPSIWQDIRQSTSSFLLKDIHTIPIHVHSDDLRKWQGLKTLFYLSKTSIEDSLKAFWSDQSVDDTRAILFSTIIPDIHKAIFFKNRDQYGTQSLSCCRNSGVCHSLEIRDWPKNSTVHGRCVFDWWQTEWTSRHIYLWRWIRILKSDLLVKLIEHHRNYKVKILLLSWNFIYVR